MYMVPGFSPVAANPIQFLNQTRIQQPQRDYGYQQPKADTKFVFGDFVDEQLTNPGADDTNHDGGHYDEQVRRVVETVIDIAGDFENAHSGQATRHRSQDLVATEIRVQDN